MTEPAKKESITNSAADNNGDKRSGKGPDLKKTLDRLGTRIDGEMARCHAQYDTARDELAEHHAKMSGEEQQVQAELDRLRPRLEQFLFSEHSEGLTPELQRQGHRYLELLSRLWDIRTAKTQSFGATLPAGKQPLGKPIGEPST